MKKIEVTCQGAAMVAPEKLKVIQGDLKSLSLKSYEKLKRSIIKSGFSFVIHVWKDEKGELCILDGTQRHRTIMKMRKEGWSCPELPVAFVQASSFKDAAKKLLVGAGMYGKPEGQGLYELMSVAGIEMEELEDVELPGIDLPKFQAEFFGDGIEEVEGDGESDTQEWTVAVSCESEEQMQEVYEELVAKGLTCKLIQ